MDSIILDNYNFKANLVCLGIDSLFWVTLAAVFGSFVGHRYYIHGHAIAAFSMVTLMTFVMILLELFGTNGTIIPWKICIQPLKSNKYDFLLWITD